jgi:hypothetical protein
MKKTKYTNNGMLKFDKTIILICSRKSSLQIVAEDVSPNGV